MVALHRAPAPDVEDDAPLVPKPAPGFTIWSIRWSDGRPVHVYASNWIAALGLALQHLGEPGCAGRLAAEMLPNGDVIANDILAGRRYVIQRT